MSSTMGHDEPVLFSARLRPHRSLSRASFLFVMGLVAAMSFATGLVFWLRGAWPVAGFAGLDLLVMWWAFRANFRAARVYEDVRLTPHTLLLSRVEVSGAEMQWRSNPMWTRLLVDRDGEGVVTALTLAYAGEKHPLGSFLGPDERTDFAFAFGNALADVKARAFQIGWTPA
jgi:uncharacterized membrane protein